MYLWRSKPHFHCYLTSYYITLFIHKTLKWTNPIQRWRACEASFHLSCILSHSLAMLCWTIATGYRQEVCVTRKGFFSLSLSRSSSTQVSAILHSKLQLKCKIRDWEVLLYISSLLHCTQWRAKWKRKLAGGRAHQEYSEQKVLGPLYNWLLF